MKDKTAFFLKADCFQCEDYGIRGFYTCTNGKVVVMCDECHTVWKDPAKITLQDASIPTAPDWEIESGCSISGSAHWSTEDEIRESGYLELVAGEAIPLL